MRTRRPPLRLARRITNQAQLNEAIRAQHEINRKLRRSTTKLPTDYPLPICVGADRQYTARSGGGDRDYRFFVGVGETARLFSLGANVLALDDAVVIAARDSVVTAHDRAFVVAADSSVVHRASPDATILRFGDAEEAQARSQRPAFYWE